MKLNLPIRLLCVDDHPLVRDGIAYALSSQADMMLVAEATDGKQALESYREHLPDITLMDLRMGESSGVEAIVNILREFSAARIIVLTTYRGDVQASRAIKAGAVGYVLKSMLRTELMETIRAVHAGEYRIPPMIRAALSNHLAADLLSERETQILQLVSEGFSNKELSQRLTLSEETVKSHIKNILSKLQASSRTHAVLIGMQRGFLDS